MQNAFVDRLGLSFNPSRMLVVDFLHEFELGIWKNLFMHILQIIQSLKKLAELDNW
jgi:hypothetical protein